MAACELTRPSGDLNCALPAATATASATRLQRQTLCFWLRLCGCRDCLLFGSSAALCAHQLACPVAQGVAAKLAAAGLEAVAPTLPHVATCTSAPQNALETKASAVLLATTASTEEPCIASESIVHADTATATAEDANDAVGSHSESQSHHDGSSNSNNNTNLEADNEDERQHEPQDSAHEAPRKPEHAETDATLDALDFLEAFLQQIGDNTPTPDAVAASSIGSDVSMTTDTNPSLSTSLGLSNSSNTSSNASLTYTSANTSTASTDTWSVGEDDSDDNEDNDDDSQTRITAAAAVENAAALATHGLRPSARRSTATRLPVTRRQLRNPEYGAMKRRANEAQPKATAFETDPKWLAQQADAQERIKLLGAKAMQPRWL